MSRTDKTPGSDPRSEARTFRFAPSPNGALHLGHAYSALLNFQLAQETGGRFLLRIEDVDVTRCRPELEAAIYDDLRWLGLSWEEPVMRQSRRGAAYADALDKLAALGVLYPCFATRAEIAAACPQDHPADPDGAPVYPGLWRNADRNSIRMRMESGEPHALRLDMARAAALGRKMHGGHLTYLEHEDDGPGQRLAANPEDWGDIVLARKEFPSSYHLAVVVDDAAQGVTHIVRGRDIFAQTPIHRLLQVLLGLPEPCYRHHRLILGPDGGKLAKSRGGESLAALRANGETSADIIRMAGLQMARAI